MPRLDPIDALALYLFQSCHTQWEYRALGMSGSMKTGIPRDRVRAVAEGLGVPWTEEILYRFSVCERVILEEENARVTAELDQG